MTTALPALQRLGRSLITLKSEPGRTARAGRWVLPIAASLLLTALLLGPATAALGLLGALAANSGRSDPMARRIKTLLVVGLTTLTMVAIGVLLAPYTWLFPPVMALLTLAVVWIWHALLTGPPGPINTLFAAAFGAYMGAHGFGMMDLLPVTTMTWGLGALGSIAVLALDPRGPGREAVDTADEAVAAYRDRSDDLSVGRANRLRSEAYEAVADAWRILRSGLAPTAVPRSASARALEERLSGIHLALIELLHTESFPTSNLDIAENFTQVPLGRPSSRYLLSAAWDRGSRPTLVAVRSALAVFLASITMIISPVGHPYWAVLSALIVLHMGASRADLTIRAAHRIIGTFVGVFVYFGIILLNPSEWVRIAIVIVAIYCMECLVTRNYAMAVTFITTFALMMTPISSSTEIRIVIRDRMVETIIGVLAAVLVIWLVGRKAPVLLVRSQYRRTLAAMLVVLGDMAIGAMESLQSHEERRNLTFELERAGVILSQQRPDDPATLSRWNPVQETVSHFGFDILAACWRDLFGGSPAAALARADLGAFIAGLPPISSQDIDTAQLVDRIDFIHMQFMGDTAREIAAR